MNRSYSITCPEALVVLSDVHLSANVQPERESAVAALLARYPGRVVVFLGDLFEFSSVPELGPSGAFERMVHVNEVFSAAIRRHTEGGGHVYFVAGNHDAELTTVGREISTAFGPNATLAPWYVRFGQVHLEHGHVFDADNAPLHPLAPHSRSHESLGAALMRSIVVGLNLRGLAHAHDLTPSKAWHTGVRTLGWRLPSVVCRGLFALCLLVCNAAFGRWGAAAAARREGTEKLAVAARVSGMTEGSLQAMVAAAPPATHANLRRMVFRLYLDCVLASLVAAVSMIAWWVGASAAIVGMFLGLGYLLVLRLSPRMHVKSGRYQPPMQALLRGARDVARLTLAKRVVFGHTHVEHDDGVYFNLGSFGYGGFQGRPYALVAPDGQVSRHFIPFDCGQEVALSNGSRNAGTR
jgi:predicted phosphodiesterase